MSKHSCLSLLIATFVCITGCTTAEEMELPKPVFETMVVDDSISIGYGLAIGHVDADGKPDIILADKKQFVWYRNGDWKRFVITENLTERDNVSIAARDINGDGLVEIAVGAMWNPGETTDPSISGSVHYLIRPPDPTQLWDPVQLPHEPTVHRMQWVQTEANAFELVVLPLHGRGNTGGEGDGVKIYAYTMPENPRDEWSLQLIDESLHMTHNFEVVEGDVPSMYIAGKEGVFKTTYENGAWSPISAVLQQAAGEVRLGKLDQELFITTIEPMHGSNLVTYVHNETFTPVILDTNFAQGHAIATADLLQIGRDQIVAGWRNQNTEGKVGMKLYVPLDKAGTTWQHYLIDDNDMAVEDLKVADLNGDGKLDIIAAGRATKNLKIYWNQTP